jgi:hypothetical protein
MVAVCPLWDGPGAPDLQGGRRRQGEAARQRPLAQRLFDLPPHDVPQPLLNRRKHLDRGETTVVTPSNHPSLLPAGEWKPAEITAGMSRTSAPTDTVKASGKPPPASAATASSKTNRRSARPSSRSTSRRRRSMLRLARRMTRVSVATRNM